MKPATIPPAAHAAVLATSQAIRHGKVGLDFTCPDTASIEWTPEAVGHVMQAIFAIDPLLAKEFIEELLHMAKAPPELLLQAHPDWEREYEKFEAEMEVEEREYQAEKYRDDCERVRDMRAPI